MKHLPAIFCLIISISATEAMADCIDDASVMYQVNPIVMRTIAENESSFNPNAYNKNSNGTVDVGLHQINSVHFKELAKYGIQPNDLWDPCINSQVAAYRLRKMMNKYGNTWTAVGAYHSETPRLRDKYAEIIKTAIKRKYP